MKRQQGQSQKNFSGFPPVLQHGRSCTAASCIPPMFSRSLVALNSHFSSAKGSGHGRWEQHSEAWCLQQCRPTCIYTVWCGTAVVHNIAFSHSAKIRCPKPLFIVILQVVLSFFPAAFSGSLTGGCECQMRTLNQGTMTVSLCACPGCLLTDAAVKKLA